MIPRILHHIWIGPKPAPRQWMETWPAAHPRWSYYEWGNDDLQNLTWWRNKQQIDRYARRGQWAGAADIMRYEILYQLGGFMPGADCVCKRPIDELLSDTFDTYAVYENEDVRPGLITPVYAARKGSPFLKEIIERIGKLRDHDMGEPWQVVGNKLMQDVYEGGDWPKMKVWPSYYFNPVHYTGHAYQGDGPIYGEQQWGSTKGKY